MSNDIDYNEQVSISNSPGIVQVGSSEKVKSVPDVQVTSLLPSFTASE